MKAVIAAYVRSPFHRAGGALAALRADTLAAQVVQGLLERSCINPALLDDLLLGCAHPHTVATGNLGRIVALLAGLPPAVGGTTIDRCGGSSMQAVHFAAAQIEAGMASAVLCVGVESMSCVAQLGTSVPLNPKLAERTDAYMSMLQTAENVAARWHISRRDQDALALDSHRKAAAAQAAGHLADEVVPVGPDGGEAVAVDGCILPDLSAAQLAALAPLQGPGGVVTAATAAPMCDGAAAVLLTSDTFASRHSIAPLARVRACASVGVEPAVMGIGPILATRMALDRGGLLVGDLDIVELHETFAAQALACSGALHLDPATVNRDGGGLAIGHPLGATGARLVGKVASLLAREGGRFALATQCIGGGHGIATVLERV